MRAAASVAGFVLAGAVSGAMPAAAQPILGGPWSGFYIGGQAGAGFNPNRLAFDDLSTAQDLGFEAHDSSNTFLGGPHIGYNWQPGGILFGVEGDVNFGKDINYLASARGRLGIPAGPFLIYGTAGAAFEGADEHFTVFQPDFPGIFNFKRNITKTGWTAGGGVEFMMTPAISLGVQGLYYGMGRDTAALTTPADVASEPFAVRDDRNFAVVTARLSYHFGW